MHDHGDRILECMMHLTAYKMYTINALNIYIVLHRPSRGINKTVKLGN